HGDRRAACDRARLRRDRAAAVHGGDDAQHRLQPLALHELAAGADLQRRDLADHGGGQPRVGSGARARRDDPAAEPDRASGLAQEPLGVSGDALGSQTANVEHANVDPESRTDSERERIAPNASPGGAPDGGASALQERSAPGGAQAVSVTLEQLRAFYGNAEQLRGVDLDFR